jgi:hypothetical protein
MATASAAISGETAAGTIVSSRMPPAWRFSDRS